MPASRSRTERWRQTLQNVCDRNGVIEIAIPRPGQDENAKADEVVESVNLVWRVRLLAVEEDALVIEEPSTMGTNIEIQQGVELIAVFTLGQNRWMFRSTSLGRTNFTLNAERKMRAIRLQSPEFVERCQRRQFYRVSTIGLKLPQADVRPLLDMAGVAAAEAAVRTRIEMLEEGALAGVIGDSEPLLLPEVGPPVTTTVVNLGGGGAGLVVSAKDAAPFDQHRLFWLTLHLEPHVPAPLSLVARLAHVRMDSEQRRYLGMSFEFSHDAEHRRFIVKELCRCVNEVQRDQLRRRALNERRPSA